METQGKRAKSWGRELGFLFVLHIFYLSTFGDPAVIEMLIWPYMSFVFWAFGVVRNAESLSSIISSTRR